MSSLARLYDGQSARAHDATLRIENGSLLIEANGRLLTWRLTDIRVEEEAGEARISSVRERDVRLTLPAGDWRALIGESGVHLVDRRRRRETLLVGGLVAMAAGLALFVFVGVPALSGPLARATPVALEQRMGANFEGQIGTLFPRCQGEAGQAALQQLGDRIEAKANTPFDVRVWAVEAPMLNALALPGGAVLLTDDLISDAKSPDELAAVISHEVAHIEGRHVMQAVWRNLGAGLLLDLFVGGGTGAGQQAVLLAGQASEFSYSRAAEAEADARGQALLHAEALSSRGMATFFERLGRSEGDSDERVRAAAEFMATHPDTRRRARVARARERSGTSALTQQQWVDVRAACRAPSDGPLDRVRRRLSPSGSNSDPESPTK